MLTGGLTKAVFTTTLLLIKRVHLGQRDFRGIRIRSLPLRQTCFDSGLIANLRGSVNTAQRSAVVPKPLVKLIPLDTDTLKLVRMLPEVQDPFQLFLVLRNDLQKPRSQLRNYRRVQVSSKALKSIQHPFHASHIEGFDATGNRLAGQLNTAQARELSARLEAALDDSEARLDLLDLLFKEGSQCNLIAFRDAYLLATLEAEATQLSTRKLNLLILAQQSYLQKLGGFLKADQANTEEKLGGGKSTSETILEAQLRRLKAGLGFVAESLKLLKQEPLRHDYTLNLKELRNLSKIPFGDIKFGLDPMLRAASKLPTMEMNRQLMLDILRRAEACNPIVGYHEAGMYEILAQLQMVIGMGTHETKHHQRTFDLLNQGLTAIRHSVNLVGDMPSKPVDYACFQKYGQLCYEANGAYILLPFPVPTEHQERMRHAVDLLSKISDKPQAQGLQQKLAQAVATAQAKHSS